MSTANPSIWNARFSDTVACYYLWHFRQMKEAGKREILESDLENARRYLEQARRLDIGDIAVPEHESALEQAELELKRLVDAQALV